MTLLLLNLLLALLWVLLWGELTLYTLLVGLVGGYFVLWVFSRVIHPDLMRQAYGGYVSDLLHFGGYFLWLLVKSNLVLAREILTPGHGMSPRILRYNVAHLSDPQIVALSNAITLTPGTLVVDISREKDFLYIHSMYARDPVRARRDLDELRERMEREVFHLRSSPVSSDAARAGSADTAPARDR